MAHIVRQEAHSTGTESYIRAFLSDGSSIYDHNGFGSNEKEFEAGIARIQNHPAYMCCTFEHAWPNEPNAVDERKVTRLKSL